MRSIPLAPLVASLLACTATPTPAGEAKSEGEATPGETKPDRTKPGETKDDAPQPDAAPFVEPVRTHLLVHAHVHDRPEAKILALALYEPALTSSSGSTSTAASGPSVVASRTHPAFPLSRWPGHFGSLVAHDGGTRYVVAQGAGEAWSLEAWSLEGSSPSASASLGKAEPAAALLVGDDVLIGQGGAVTWVDLAAPAAAVPLRERTDMFGKAYDVFLRSGAWVIAVDDVVSPIYADGFRLGAAKPEHVQDFVLPSAINGSYYAGTMVARGPADATLYLLLGYGIMDGHGHDLSALPIRAGKLAVPEGVILNSSARTDPPVLEEHVDRGSGLPETLAFGDVYSEWTQIAHAPAVAGGAPRLLISAVERGLLELPVDFGPTTKAKAIDVGGKALDVIVIGGRVYVLVEVSEPLVRSELVELALLPEGATVERRTALPEVYHRFVR